MSDQTTNWDLPYPQLADAANIETAVKPLADRLETVFNALFGTGTLTEAAVRTALGLVIGTDVQAHDTDLDAIAALSTTPYGRSLLEAANAAALRTLAGSVIGTDVQAHDADLDSIAALATTSFGRSLLTAAAAANLPGGEIGYDPITSNVTVTGSFSTVIAGSAYTFDGAPVIAEFFTPGVDAPPSNAQVQICLFEGATNLGMLAQITNPAAGFLDVPVLGRFRFTPSAGAHTYSVKAVRTGSSNGTLYADTGASGAHMPAYLRLTKA